MIDRELPYKIACQIYNQGIECDWAARKIRQLLPEFLSDISREVQEEMGKNYKKAWETPRQFEYMP
jgi:hypothetical protein